METQREIESPRFLWVTALIIAVSVAAVLIVREIAICLLHPSPKFLPLAVGPPILDTVVCVIVAIFVFMKIAPNPHRVRAWRSVATAVLVVSFTPDALIARSHSMGGGWPEAKSLMVMHVVVWAICITLLPALAYTTPEASEDHRKDRLSIL